jgi:hypothetical protein
MLAQVKNETQNILHTKQECYRPNATFTTEVKLQLIQVI